MPTLFGGLAGEARSDYALALFPGASYTTGWDATLITGPREISADVWSRDQILGNINSLPLFAGR